MRDDEDGEDPPALPKPPAPKSQARLIAETTSQAGVAAIPFVGGSLAVLMAQAFSRAYERRLREWVEQLANVVQELLGRVEGLETTWLAEDPDFLDAVATATRIAEKTSSIQKRASLQNALLNIGSGHSPGPDKQAMFLRHIDDLTESHMRVLGVLHDPAAAVRATGQQSQMGSLRGVFEQVEPAIGRDEAFLNALLGDLYRSGLTVDTGMGAIMSGGAFQQPRTTPLGREFLSFVSGPFGG